MNDTHTKYTLLHRFREFYRELVKQKRTAESGIVRFQAMTNSAEPPSAAKIALSVWQNIVYVLEQQNIAAQMGAGGSDYSGSARKEALYVMAALADEVFLNLQWEGKSEWQGRLLESYFFQSHVAGEQFFRNLDSLLQLRDPASVELASVYFMALALGFKGKYRGLDQEPQLMLYRQKIFAFIFRRDPELLQSAGLLIPEAYENSIVKGEPKRLANPRRWYIAAAAAMIVLLGISQLLWYDVTEDFEPTLQQLSGAE